MRDPRRIQGYCDRLARAWERLPDWRFGQFMCNVIEAYYDKTKQDPFFPEDEEMIRFIEEYVGIGEDEQ